MTLLTKIKYTLSAIAMTSAIDILPVSHVSISHAVQAQETSEQIRWNLTDLYPSVYAWNIERERVTKEISTIAKFKGTLGNSAESLQGAFDAISAINKEAARVYIYASLAGDENLRDATGQERLSLARSMFAALGQQTAFISPEILKIGSEKIEAYIAANTGLKKHAFQLRDILRQEPHTLGQEAESVLANSIEVTGGAQRIYSLLSTAAIPWPKATLSNEQVVTLNQAAYSRYRAVQNREDRKKVFDTFWGTWKTYEAPMGQMLDTLIRGHIFTAKSRGYENSLEQAVSGGNIPSDVYRKLVASANKNLPSMHRYLKLRQRIMGLPDLHYYDIYPEVTQLENEFSVEQAKQLTLNSLQPFGEEYLGLLKQGLDADWMHVYPQPGKRSGAYMQGAGYDVHPYILLNFNKGFEDVSTFSHEWGHAVHTLLARANNPYETYSYTTFTAELASTTNEVLLQEYMLAKDLSDEERLYYIDRALEGIRGSFFRQTMFAEFELRVHELAEAGEALSGRRMTELYLELLKKYHGHDEGVMTIDPAYAIEWAYIPHFYYNFYVYQYATSISGGTMFAERILAGDDTARDDYINTLKAGGSQYPHPLLQKAGVDLTTDAPYDTLINRMNRLMDEAEAILDKMDR
jgi:oligoendopeptidase F